MLSHIFWWWKFVVNRKGMVFVSPIIRSTLLFNATILYKIFLFVNSLIVLECSYEFYSIHSEQIWGKHTVNYTRYGCTWRNKHFILRKSISIETYCRRRVGTALNSIWYSQGRYQCERFICFTCECIIKTSQILNETVIDRSDDRQDNKRKSCNCLTSMVKYKRHIRIIVIFVFVEQRQLLVGVMCNKAFVQTTNRKINYIFVNKHKRRRRLGLCFDRFEKKKNTKKLNEIELRVYVLIIVDENK